MQAWKYPLSALLLLAVAALGLYLPEWLARRGDAARLGIVYCDGAFVEGYVSRQWQARDVVRAYDEYARYGASASLAYAQERLAAGDADAAGERLLPILEAAGVIPPAALDTLWPARRANRFALTAGASGRSFHFVQITRKADEYGLEADLEADSGLLCGLTVESSVVAAPYEDLVQRLTAYPEDSYGAADGDGYRALPEGVRASFGFADAVARALLSQVDGHPLGDPIWRMNLEDARMRLAYQSAEGVYGVRVEFFDGHFMRASLELEG